ncbi:hypothetical protein EGW08_019852 [Elysia chlorotica]|uniref:Fibrinogen C-terminal domain-containing protein n=1 Tax=Elysia chlorotica TaxID=188477 RepID=A0A433ST08_ELYCH|nr:hypothetical protein EGW08_019852 [Elysia chlorotica]
MTWRGFLEFLVIEIGFMLFATALEIRLDLETKFVPGGHTTCGVLLCREEGTYPRINLISQMDVFRSRGDTGSSVKVASLTEGQPTLSRMWSGLKVDGAWAKQKAEITLHLVEEIDCRQAEFSCRLSFVDGLGLQRVSVSRVGGSGQEIAIDEPEVHTNVLSESVPAFTGAAALQLSAIIQQTHSSLEGALRQLQARLDDTSRLSENRLEDKLSKVVDAVDRLERNIEKDRQRDACQNSSLTQVNEKLKNTSERLKSIETNVVGLHVTMQKVIESNAQIDLKVGSFNALSENQISAFYKASMNVSDYIHNSVAEALHSSQVAILNQLESEDGFGRVKLSTCEKDSFTQPSLAADRVVVPLDQGAPYLCDTVTDGGGWVVIQRRSTGSVDFYQDWDTYKAGFGSLDGDFWLGNEKIYALTSTKPHEIMISLKLNGISKFAHYDYFSISNETSGYRLNIGQYSGTAGDSMQTHRNMAFSTLDKDHDLHKTLNCAKEFQGAWWYRSCHSSNLNGRWGDRGDRGPSWSSISRSQPVTFSEMKIRSMPT